MKMRVAFGKEMLAVTARETVLSPAGEAGWEVAPALASGCGRARPAPRIAQKPGSGSRSSRGRDTPSGKELGFKCYIKIFSVK